MKKVRHSINIILGAMIAALGLASCERGEYMTEYGVPIVKYGAPDTTAHCMYGVDPNPTIDWDADEEPANQ